MSHPWSADDAGLGVSDSQEIPVASFSSDGASLGVLDDAISAMASGRGLVQVQAVYRSGRRLSVQLGPDRRLEAVHGDSADIDEDVFPFIGALTLHQALLAAGIDRRRVTEWHFQRGPRGEWHWFIEVKRLLGRRRVMVDMAGSVRRAR